MILANLVLSVDGIDALRSDRTVRKIIIERRQL